MVIQTQGDLKLIDGCGQSGLRTLKRTVFHEGSNETH